MSKWFDKLTYAIPIVILIVLGALLGPASAFAAPTWLPPSRLSSLKGAQALPAVAMDLHGDSVAVWTVAEGAGVKRVEASVRPAGGSWSTPVPLPAAGQIALNPQVAFDGAGDATVVWLEVEGSSSVLRSVAMPAGSGWIPAVDVSSAGDRPSGFDLAVGSAGEAIVAYEERVGGKTRVGVTTRRAGGTWTAAATVSAAGDEAFAPSVALGDGGAAAVIWATVNTVQAVERPLGGSWTEPADVATGQASYSPAIAVAPDGEVVALWRKAGGEGALVEVASETAGVWSPPQYVGAGFFYSGPPQIAIDADGEAVALWERSEAGVMSVLTASRSHGGAFTTPLELSHPGATVSFAPRLAISPAGQATAVWLTGQSAASVVTAAVRPVGGGWGMPTDLTAPGSYANAPVVAADAGGDAVAVWESGNGPAAIEAVGFDGAGPELRYVAIPASGTAGTPASFSVGNSTSADGAITVGPTASGAAPKAGGPAPEPGGPAPEPDRLARSRRTALVHGGRAALVLNCAAAPCTGVAELLLRPQPHRSATAKASRLHLFLAGKSPFNVSTAQATIEVTLRPAVLARLRSAANYRLKVRLRGRGIQAGPLTLRLPPQHH